MKTQSYIQKVSGKGQVVIPSKVRDALGLKYGSSILVSADYVNKSIHIKPAPKNPIDAAAGMFKSTLEKNKNVMKEFLAEKYKEIEDEDK